MVIHFTDGASLEFEFPPIENDLNSMELINRLQNDQSIALHAEGRVYVIPMQNVRYVDVSPAPEKVANKVVHNARLIRMHAP